MPTIKAVSAPRLPHQVYCAISFVAFMAALNSDAPVFFPSHLWILSPTSYYYVHPSARGVEFATLVLNQNSQVQFLISYGAPLALNSVPFPHVCCFPALPPPPLPNALMQSWNKDLAYSDCNWEASGRAALIPVLSCQEKEEEIAAIETVEGSGRSKACVRTTGRRRFPRTSYNKMQSKELAIKKNDSRTTVMIRNLPVKFTMEKVLRILDQHCYEENEKPNNERGEKRSAALSEFDFVYLPIDFGTGNSMGYAFVNFTSSIAAWRLYRYLHNYQWKPYGSRKICAVVYARIQGWPALEKHFESATFRCSSDEYLPAFFYPPRNGYRKPDPKRVGKRRNSAELLKSEA